MILAFVFARSCKIEERQMLKAARIHENCDHSTDRKKVPFMFLESSRVSKHLA